MRNRWQIDAVATKRALASLCRVSVLFSRFSVLPPLFAITYTAIIRPRIFRDLSPLFPPTLHCFSCQRHVGVITLRRRILEKRSLLSEAVAGSIKKKRAGCSCASRGPFGTKIFKAARKASPSIMRCVIDILSQFLSLPCF